MKHFTCAGGHEGLGFLPTAVRNRMLRRALSFQPDAAIANGDHVYWDLRSPLTARNEAEPRRAPGRLPAARLIVPTSVLGSENETILKRAAGPQIVPVYGTDFRSTPVFFIQDDHDYYENDDAYDEIVTFPPDDFMTEMARATQSLYYPEFLPDRDAPARAGGFCVGRTRAADFREFRHAALRPPCGGAALHGAPDDDHGGAECGVSRRGGRGLAHSPDDGSRRHARRERPVEPAGLDGRQVGRMVPRRARRRRQTHDRMSRSPTGSRVG